MRTFAVVRIWRHTVFPLPIYKMETSREPKKRIKIETAGREKFLRSKKNAILSEENFFPEED